jgi:hypothetical protein
MHKLINRLINKSFATAYIIIESFIYLDLMVKNRKIYTLSGEQISVRHVSKLLIT